MSNAILINCKYCSRTLISYLRKLKYEFSFCCVNHLAQMRSKLCLTVAFPFARHPIDVICFRFFCSLEDDLILFSILQIARTPFNYGVVNWVTIQYSNEPPQHIMHTNEKNHNLQQIRGRSTIFSKCTSVCATEYRQRHTMKHCLSSSKSVIYFPLKNKFKIFTRFGRELIQQWTTTITAAHRWWFKID